ncbi:MAG: HNH endonuclease signature motif containing protein, partial [Actinomycetes bacterium]
RGVMDEGVGVGEVDAGGHPMQVGLAAGSAGLELAAGVGVGRVWQLSGVDTRRVLVEVLRVQAMVAAVVAAVVGHAEATGVRSEVGASSTARWLASTARMTQGQANEWVRVATAVGRQPQAGGLLATGVAGVEHALVVATTLERVDLLAGVDPDTRARAVGFLVEQAAVLDPIGLARVGRGLVEALTTVSVDAPGEQAGVEREAVDRGGDRFFHHRREADGTWSGRYRGLDAVSGAALEAFLYHAGLLVPAGETSPHADTSTSTDPHAGTDPHADTGPDRGAGAGGGGGLVGGDRRTSAQRRLDGLGALARYGLAHADLAGDAEGRQPVLVVTCEYDTLSGQLAGGRLDTGEPVPVHQLRRLACTARILPVVMGGASRVLDLGRARRLFSGAQRRALGLRDRGCSFPGCDAPPRARQAHHQWYWEHAGPTDLDNGCLLCDYHHGRVHREGWTSRLSPVNGHVQWQPPPVLDPSQRWQQHHRHRVRELTSTAA